MPPQNLAQAPALPHHFPILDLHSLTHADDFLLVGCLGLAGRTVVVVETNLNVHDMGMLRLRGGGDDSDDAFQPSKVAVRRVPKGKAVVKQVRKTNKMKSAGRMKDKVLPAVPWVYGQSTKLTGPCLNGVCTCGSYDGVSGSGVWVRTEWPSVCENPAT